LRRSDQFDEYAVGRDDNCHRDALSGWGSNGDATNTVGETQRGQGGKRLVDVTLQGEQEETIPRSLGWSRRVPGALKDNQFNDAGIGCLWIAQEDRPQPIGLGAEEFWPIAGEVMVEQLGEAEAVAPESQRSFDIGRANCRVMNTEHEFPFRSAGLAAA
jgi:hypothetical protein